MGKHSRYIASEKCKVQNSTRLWHHINKEKSVYIYEKYRKDIRQILIVVIFG